MHRGASCPDWTLGSGEGAAAYTTAAFGWQGWGALFGPDVTRLCPWVAAGHTPRAGARTLLSPGPRGVRICPPPNHGWVLQNPRWRGDPPHPRSPPSGPPLSIRAPPSVLCSPTSGDWDQPRTHRRGFHAPVQTLRGQIHRPDELDPSCGPMGEQASRTSPSIPQFFPAQDQGLPFHPPHPHLWAILRVMNARTAPRCPADLTTQASSLGEPSWGPGRPPDLRTSPRSLCRRLFSP